MKKSVLLGLGAVALGATAAIVVKKILDSEPVGDDDLFGGSEQEECEEDTEVPNEKAKDVCPSHLNDDDFVDEEDMVKLTKPMPKDEELETPPVMVEPPIVAPATESVPTEDTEVMEDVADEDIPEDITDDMPEVQEVEPVQEQPSKVLGESVVSETPAVSKVLHDLEQAADKAEQ